MLEDEDFNMEQKVYQPQLHKDLGIARDAPQLRNLRKFGLPAGGGGGGGGQRKTRLYKRKQSMMLAGLMNTV
jgi:hypothetical protein